MTAQEARDMSTIGLQETKKKEEQQKILELENQKKENEKKSQETQKVICDVTRCILDAVESETKQGRLNYQYSFGIIFPDEDIKSGIRKNLENLGFVIEFRKQSEKFTKRGWDGDFLFDYYEYVYVVNVSW